MTTVKNYLSLIKFSHTIFALPFAMIGFSLGVWSRGGFAAMGAHEWWRKFLLVLVCMVTARSAAMAFNRYLDRQFDAKNPRTAIREIPAGIIGEGAALRFVVFNAFLFWLATWFINPICFYLAPVALFVILFYSYTKRFTPLCHVVLGLGLSLAPIGAYLAVTGTFAWVPILFSLAVICWVSGFDIIYAMQDEAFDKQESLYSMPAWLGGKKALQWSAILHMGSALCIFLAGYLGGFGWLYWVGVLIFVSMLVYQHSLVKPHDLSKVNLAFMTTNGIASVVFAGCAITDLII
jgi:4-hydroxybenzoate polyprenyltransferase